MLLSTGRYSLFPYLWRSVNTLQKISQLLGTPMWVCQWFWGQVCLILNVISWCGGNKETSLMEGVRRTAVPYSKAWLSPFSIYVIESWVLFTTKPKLGQFYSKHFLISSTSRLFQPMDVSTLICFAFHDFCLNWPGIFFFWHEVLPRGAGIYNINM